MQKSISLSLIYLMFSTLTIGQTFDWIKSIGGTYDESSWSTALDELGNVYTTGYFKDTVDFDPNTGVTNLISEFANDVFIQKLDSSGNLIWAKNMGGLGSDALGSTTAVDDFGNVYIAGRFNGTADFDPNAGVTNLTAVGSSDIFIVKLDSTGNLVWANRFGGSTVFNNENVYKIVIDNLGNPLVTGYFYGIVDFDPGPGIENLTAGGGANANRYFLKLDSDGNYLWAKNIEGPTAGWTSALALDDSDNIYTTGWFDGPVDFDPNAGVYNITPVDNLDIFILKLDSDGNFTWVKTMDGSSYESGRSIAVDISGNVYTMGIFQDTVDFDPGLGTSDLVSAGGADIFIQKIDSNGNFLWAKSMGGIQADIGHSITVDNWGNVYSTGYFHGTADFNPSIDTTYLIANNSFQYHDAFIQKLNTDGDFLWAKSMGGSLSDSGTSIITDNTGNVYVTGLFSDTVDFNPLDGTYNLENKGGNDVFILKLKPCFSNTAIDIISACDSITWIDGKTYTTSNNTATHTLINAECCDSVVTLDLTLMSIELDTVGNIGCLDDHEGFINTSISGGNPPFNFVWNSGDSTPNITDLNAGFYSLTVTDDNGCVKIWEDTLEASFTPDIYPFVGQMSTTDTIVSWNDVILVDAGNNQTVDGVIYSWVETSGLGNINFADDTAPSTTINPRPNSAGTYDLRLTATSEDGCVDTGSLRVTIESFDNIVIPNIFTPNGDGLNDFFSPVGLDDQFILEFKIYNRWGQIVFDGKGANNAWDGTFKGEKQSSDIYTYILYYQIPNQTKNFLKGDFTLIR